MTSASDKRFAEVVARAERLGDKLPLAYSSVWVNKLKSRGWSIGEITGRIVWMIPPGGKKLNTEGELA